MAHTQSSIHPEKGEYCLNYSFRNNETEGTVFEIEMKPNDADRQYEYHAVSFNKQEIPHVIEHLKEVIKQLEVVSGSAKDERKN